MGYVFYLNIATFKSFLPLVGFCKNLANCLQGIYTVLDKCQTSTFITAYVLCRAVKSGLYVFGVSKCLCFLFKFGHFAFFQLCFIQLLKLEPYIVFLFSCFFRFGYTVIQFLAYFSVLAVFVLVVCQLPCILCKYIQYIELKSFLVDKQVLVLAVDVNQLLSENFHLCQ